MKNVLIIIIYGNYPFQGVSRWRQKRSRLSYFPSEKGVFGLFSSTFSLSPFTHCEPTERGGETARWHTWTERSPPLAFAERSKGHPPAAGTTTATAAIIQVEGARDTQLIYLATISEPFWLRRPAPAMPAGLKNLCYHATRMAPLARSVFKGVDRQDQPAGSNKA